MKRRGFLGSVVSLIAGSALAAKTQPIISEAEVIQDPKFIKGKTAWLASGTVNDFIISAPVDGDITIIYPNGTRERYTEERHMQLLGERW